MRYQLQHPEWMINPVVYLNEILKIPISSIIIEDLYLIVDYDIDITHFKELGFVVKDDQTREDVKSLALKNVRQKVLDILRSDIEKYLRVHTVTKLRYNPTDLAMDGMSHDQHQGVLTNCTLSGKFLALSKMRGILNKIEANSNESNKVGIKIIDRYQLPAKKPDDRIDVTAFSVLFYIGGDGDFIYEFDKKREKEKIQRKRIDRSKVKEFVDEGLSTKKIADRLKAHPGSINLVCRSLGIKTINPAKKIDRIVLKQLLDEGKLDEEIAKVFDCNPHSVGNLVTSKYPYILEKRKKQRDELKRLKIINILKECIDDVRHKRAKRGDIKREKIAQKNACSPGFVNSCYRKYRDNVRIRYLSDEDYQKLNEFSGLNG